MAFKKDFLWGTSISAAQAEGGWNEGGRGPVHVDFANAGSAATNGRKLLYRAKDGSRAELPGAYAMFPHPPEGGQYTSYDDAYYPNRKASDFYHQYK